MNKLRRVFLTDLSLYIEEYQSKEPVTVFIDDNNPSKKDLKNFAYDLYRYGFHLSESAYKQLKKMSSSDFKKVVKEVLSCFSDLLENKVTSDLVYGNMHSHRNFIPCSLNFDLPEVEDDYTEIYSLKEKETVQINLLTLEYAIKKVTTYLNSPISLGKQQKEFINIFNQEIPEDICPKNKENIAFLTTIDFKYFSLLKTPTDVLRAATALSGGDISLKKPVKFKLNRYQRKAIANALNGIINESNIEELRTWENRWKALAHNIHIGEFSNKYSEAYKALSQIRKNPKVIKTFESRILNSEKDTVLDLIKTRPGVFARKLNYLIRKYGEDVITQFDLVADKVSPIVLMQMVAHFRSYRESRSFLLKDGAIFKKKEIVNPLEEKVLDKIQNILHKTLSKIYGASAKNVFISPVLKNHKIPQGLRSFAENTKTLTRGSRIPVAEKVRFFLWWENEMRNGVEERTDLDLSAVFLDEDLKQVGYVDFCSLETEGCRHSGDEVDAPIERKVNIYSVDGDIQIIDEDDSHHSLELKKYPFINTTLNGAAEYIDVDLKKLANRGIRYVVMNVYGYTDSSFVNVNCKAGFINAPVRGVYYDPSKVETSFKLNADAKAAIPLIIDTQEQCFIWADIMSKGRDYSNSVRSNNMSEKLKEIIDSKVISLYELALYVSSGAKIDEEMDPEKEYDFMFTEDLAYSLENMLHLMNKQEVKNAN